MEYLGFMEHVIEEWILWEWNGSPGKETDQVTKERIFEKLVWINLECFGETWSNILRHEDSSCTILIDVAPRIGDVAPWGYILHHSWKCWAKRKVVAQKEWMLRHEGVTLHQEVDVAPSRSPIAPRRRSCTTLMRCCAMAEMWLHHGQSSYMTRHLDSFVVPCWSMFA